MRKVSTRQATGSLAQYARELNGAPLLITEAGRPIAALVPVCGVDLETLAVGTNPDFLDLIEQSRRRERAEGGLSGDEVCRRLGLKPTVRKSRTPRQKAKQRATANEST